MGVDVARPPRWNAWHLSPVFRHEVGYWEAQLGGRWRLDDLFIGLALLNLCLLPAALLIYPPLLLVYAALDEALGMVISLPAALSVARERQAQTWELLRATTLSLPEIALGKLTGLMTLGWEGAALLVQARWVGAVLAAPLFALMLTTRPTGVFVPEVPGWLGLGAVGLALVLFVVRPLVSVFTGACLGLACSLPARTMPASLTTALLANGLALTLTAGAVLATWQLGAAAALFQEGVLAGRLALVFVWLLPLGGLSLARLLVLPAWLWLVVRQRPQEGAA